MTLLQKLTPTNLLEEKEKFLADNSYNPQFIYSEEITASKLLQYGKPKQKYLTLAQEILDRAYFGRNEADLLMMEGPIISHQEVNQKIASFLDMHHLTERYQVIWSSSFVSRASITKDKIKLRTSSEFRKDDLIGMLYHEIGTHALRNINYEQQPWFKKKKEFGFSDYLLTEEGLASLHSLLPKDYKSAYKSAIRYVSVTYAQAHSFSELWKFLGNYIQDPETRWMVTIRQKRGLTDTSHPGGYSKDLVYFAGMIEVWRWLKERNFNPSDLYFGKISFKDVQKAIEMNPEFEPKLPSFFSINPVQYAAEIEKIGEENQFKR